MTNFSITLDNQEYKCTSTQRSAEDSNWHVTTKHGNVSTTITVPCENKITRAKVILFVEAFHVAMRNAFEAQLLDKNYIWNQKSTIM